MNRLHKARLAIDSFDNAAVKWMSTYGHFIERIGLAIIFFWFGLLKVFGHTSATSIIGKTIYLTSPEVMVPILGLWEALIGVCFFFRRFVRVAIVLLAVRLIGSFSALLLRIDACFVEFPQVPTIQGQYLIKELALIGAALVLGATVRLNACKNHWF